MIILKFQTHQISQTPLRPNLLEHEIIRLKRPRFEPVLSELKCDNREHSHFENIITVNVSPDEYLLIEKICCVEFEQKITDASMEICRIKK